MCSGADFVDEITRIMCAKCQCRDECAELEEEWLDELAACVSAMKIELSELIGSTRIAQFGS